MVELGRIECEELTMNKKEIVLRFLMKIVVVVSSVDGMAVMR